MTFQQLCDDTYQSWATVSEYETVYRSYEYDGPSIVYQVRSEYSDGTEEIHYQGHSELKAEEAWERAISGRYRHVYGAKKDVYTGSPGLTKVDLLDSRYKGLQDFCTYDTATPMTLMRAIEEKTGQYPRLCVYGYPKDRANAEGLIPLDNETEAILKTYEHIVGYRVRMGGYEDFYRK